MALHLQLMISSLLEEKRIVCSQDISIFGFSVILQNSKSVYSLYKTVWWIPKLFVIAHKKCLLLQIKTITIFLLFRMEYILSTGIVYLVIDA